MEKAKRKKRKQYTTFKIITGNEKNIRSVRYPKKLPKILLISSVTFIILTLALTFGSILLSEDYQVKLENIKSLEGVNTQQQEEINALNFITAEVKEKLKSLEKIESKVKEMVGIKE